MKIHIYESSDLCFSQGSQALNKAVSFTKLGLRFSLLYLLDEHKDHTLEIASYK